MPILQEQWGSNWIIDVKLLAWITIISITIIIIRNNVAVANPTQAVSHQATSC